MCLWAAGGEAHSGAKYLPSSWGLWETPVAVVTLENLSAMKILDAVAAASSHAVNSHVLNSHVVGMTESGHAVNSHAVVTTENSHVVGTTVTNHDEVIVKSPVVVVTVRNPVVVVIVRSLGAVVIVRSLVAVMIVETPCKEDGHLGEVFQPPLSCRSGSVQQHTGLSLWASLSRSSGGFVQE